ncbi:DNA primase regulatory subunit PriL [Halorientalis salina]|uniref:DNA primase regulatory subunit PriL n=1 Tax=Halorientalis salina TaxID=2932266 RepID=UPI0010AC5CBB|nr:DNA primase regulatory subunit PriL [Halorientalis salina]
MKALHARYPFLSGAREAVESAGVDLATLVATEDEIVERGLERIEWAITEGTVGEQHRRTRVELLSYPVARVLVSLVDQHILLRRYSRAEAKSAHERFSEELSTTTEFQSTRTERLELDTLLAEFEMRDSVREVGPDGDGEYRVDVGTYLEHAAGEWGDEWRLVNRPLADGQVPVDEGELLVLLRQAVEARVTDGLPFEVPDAIAEELTEEVERIRELLDDLDLTREIDTVVPDLFPPCMKHLLDKVQKGEHLEHHSRFAIAAFLTSIGMTTDEIVELFEVNPGFGEEQTRYQVDHIRGATSPTEYSTPACATMQSYGDCIGKDDICEDVINESHPLNYYEHRIEQADDEELEDWREDGEDGAEDESGAAD